MVFLRVVLYLPLIPSALHYLEIYIIVKMSVKLENLMFFKYCNIICSVLSERYNRPV